MIYGRQDRGIFTFIALSDKNVVERCVTYVVCQPRSTKINHHLPLPHNTPSPMHIYHLADHLPESSIQALESCISRIPWFQGIPGGFIHNSPNRKVYTYGDGGAIHENGAVSPGWSRTHWTAKITRRNATLTSKPQPLPSAMAAVIPTLRRLFSRHYPDAQCTPYTFNIAVCNYYTERDMRIAAHRDDNAWYPHETPDGPVFASLTLYPRTRPACREELGRFQIRRGGAWEQVDLDHGSLMVMSSRLEHRVQPQIKKRAFHPRINITFRSSYPLGVNPLMNLMAVSNHTRYYGIPIELRLETETPSQTETHSQDADIVEAFVKFNRTQGLDRLKVEYRTLEPRLRGELLRRVHSRYYGVGFGGRRPRVTPNMVAETVERVIMEADALMILQQRMD